MVLLVCWACWACWAIGALGCSTSVGQPSLASLRSDETGNTPILASSLLGRGLLVDVIDWSVGGAGYGSMGRRVTLDETSEDSLDPLTHQRICGLVYFHCKYLRTYRVSELPFSHLAPRRRSDGTMEALEGWKDGRRRRQTCIERPSELKEILPMDCSSRRSLQQPS